MRDRITRRSAAPSPPPTRSAWEGARLTFEIPPTFLQGWPLKLLCAILVAGLLWLGRALRIRSRLVDRLRERERVARDIHDALVQAIQALMLYVQLALDRLPTDDPARRDLEQAMDQTDEVVAAGRDRLRDPCD